MASISAADEVSRDPTAGARGQAILRFAIGVTAAFVVSEAMEWFPTFLAPVLFAILVTSLPSSPPFKTGLALVLVMTAAAWVALAVPSLLGGAPHIMFGALGVILFLAFVAMAQGRAKLPAVLLLLCMSTIPVIAMTFPAQASVLPIAMVRSMAVALVILWGSWALYPRAVPQSDPNEGASQSTSIASPVRSALTGTVIVLPLMLAYLMLGLTDALPVLVTTILLIATFDPRQGATQGLAMILGNLIGGMIALAIYLLLGIAPSLVTLALLSFLVALAFALRIDRGGAGAAIALISCNSTFIILGSAIAAGPSNSGIWLARLTQFALACAFAIAMMSLVWGTGRGSRDGSLDMNAPSQTPKET